MCICVFSSRRDRTSSRVFGFWFKIGVRSKGEVYGRIYEKGCVKIRNIRKTFTILSSTVLTWLVTFCKTLKDYNSQTGKEYFVFLTQSWTFGIYEYNEIVLDCITNTKFTVIRRLTKSLTLNDAEKIRHKTND